MMANRPESWPVMGLGFDQYHARPANLLRRVHQTSCVLFVQGMADPDMTQPRFEALMGVNKYPGDDQITLARGLGVDRSTTTLVLDGLAASGWIERTIHAEDRRKRVLHTTEAGREILARARAHADAAEAKLLAPLAPPQVAGLVEAMVKVVTAVPSSAPEFANMSGGDADSWVPRHLSFLVRRCVQVSHAMVGDAGKPFDLTPQQFGILYALAIAPSDEAGVSRMVGVDRSAVEKVLRRLKARGYLERQADALRLTPEGEEAFHAMRGPAEATDCALLDCLTAEQREAFMGGLLKLVAYHKV